MDLRQLRYFLSIVEHGSISRAAEAIHIAQPVLSLHLKRLEQEFACELVHRTPRGVVPTEYGRRLAQRGQAVLESLGALRDDVRGMQATPSGPTAVGIPTSLGTIVTVPLVQAVRQRFPGIHLRIVEGLSGHMLEWVASGNVDMAVIFGTLPPAGLSTTFLAREQLSFVGPKSCPDLQGLATAEADSVLNFPLILPGRPHGVREEAERLALTLRRTLNVVVEVDALDQIKALVAAGIGYTILSERFARHGPMAGQLKSLPIINPTVERTISLAHASDRPLSIAAQAVRGLLLEQFPKRSLSAMGGSSRQAAMIDPTTGSGY